jgi:hypothetical protein
MAKRYQIGNQPIWYLLAIVLFVPLQWILITYLVSFGHCVVCSSSMDSDYLSIEDEQTTQWPNDTK